MTAPGGTGGEAVVDVHNLFLHIAVILLTGKLFGMLFKRLGVPAVLGEVLAGVVIGQSILGLIPLSESIKVLAELGVILLLFEVGLEADIHMLLKVGLASTLVASLGAVLPFAGGFILSHYIFDMSLLSSLFIGGALTATSIGITVKVLSDLGKKEDKFAQIVLGAAVLDDVIGVVILAALYEFSKSGQVNWSATAGLIRDITIFFIVAPFVARLAAKLIYFVVYRLKDLDVIPPLILSLVLFTGYGAYRVGSPEILGAFTAGLALSRTFAVPFITFLRLDERVLHSVEESIKHLVWVVSPIFFVTVGLALNFNAIDFGSLRFWLLSLSLIAVALLGKVVSGLLVPVSFRDRINIGLSMVPRGEVGLIFAEFGRSFGAIDETGYAVVVFVVAVTTLLAPILLKLNIRT